MISDGPLAVGVVAMQAAPLAVKRSALRRTRLSDEVTRSPRVRIVDGYERVFNDSAGGFSVPLVASGEMFGLLNVEYPHGRTICRRTTSRSRSRWPISCRWRCATSTCSARRATTATICAR